MYIYIGKKPNGTYNQYPKIFSFFFHFKCILLQISHKKCFLLTFLYSGVPGLRILAFTWVKCAAKSEIEDIL